MEIFANIGAIFSNRPPALPWQTYEFPPDPSDNVEKTVAETPERLAGKAEAKAEVEKQALRLRDHILRFSDEPQQQGKIEQALKKYLVLILNNEAVCSFSNEEFLSIAEKFMGKLTFADLQDSLTPEGTRRAAKLAGDSWCKPLDILSGAEFERQRALEEKKVREKMEARKARQKAQRERSKKVTDCLDLLSIPDLNAEKIAEIVAVYNEMDLSPEKISIALGLAGEDSKYLLEAEKMLVMIEDDPELKRTLGERLFLLRRQLNPGAAQVPRMPNPVSPPGY